MLIRIGLLLSLLSFFFFNICHASLNKIPEESDIIQSILAESQKEKSWRDSSALILIKDFAYQKLKDYAKKNEAFAKELIFGTDELKNVPEDAVDIIRLENGYLLLTVSTMDVGHSSDDLYFFLIHNGESDWIPLQFDFTKKQKGYKPWALSCYKVKYEIPFLKIYFLSGGTTSCGQSCSDIDVFLFKNGSFKLVRTLSTFIDMKRQFEDLNKGIEEDYLDYIKEEVISY